MAIPTVKLAYRQVVDASAQTDFEKNVFNETYAELALQAKVYNREGKFNTVAEMISANPKANSLHYKVGFAVGLYLNELNKQIPQLKDVLGNTVSFDIVKTEIVHSDVTNKMSHAVALTYITSPQILIASLGEFLVLGKADNAVHLREGLETYTLALQPGLSIIYWANAIGQEV